MNVMSNQSYEEFTTTFRFSSCNLWLASKSTWNYEGLVIEAWKFFYYIQNTIFIFSQDT